MSRSFESLTAQVKMTQPVEPGPPLITTDKAEHAFGKDVGVFDLTFTVPKGVIFGLVGPSGCGKTTTVRLLNGMYRPTAGKIQVFGEHPHKFRTNTKEKIGYMPQQFVLYPMLTVSENLAFVASLYGMNPLTRGRRMKWVLKFVELHDERNRLAGQLSGGMQRRLQLACSLIHDPHLIFADEPTAGVDPVLRGKFWEHFRALRDDGHTMFVTTQYVGEIEHCDLVGIMRAGRLVYLDTPEQLRRQAFGGEIVRLLVDSSKAREAVNLLNDNPIVIEAHQIRSQPGVILVSVEDAAAALPDLVGLLQGAGIQANEADKFAPPFDDVFIELMKQADSRNV